MVLALLSLAAPASAAAPAAGASNPSVDQYVERVPSAGGDGAPRDTPRSSGGDGLSPSVQRQLDQAGGRTAEALEAVASSPALGAPDRPARSSGKPDAAPPEMTSDPSPFDAVTSAATSDGGGASGWLIAGLAALTAALAGTALARKRSLGR